MKVINKEEILEELKLKSEKELEELMELYMGKLITQQIKLGKKEDDTDAMLGVVEAMGMIALLTISASERKDV